jgi:hypothetical protein
MFVAIKVALLAKASRLAHVYKDWLARTVNLCVSRNNVLEIQCGRRRQNLN